MQWPRRASPSERLQAAHGPSPRRRRSIRILVRHTDVAALAGSVARQLFGGDAQGREDFSPWHVQFRSIEGARARTRYLVRRMLAPTMADYELIRLPESLFPLYWVIRPFRMAVQYGPRLLRGSADSSNA